MTDTFLYNSFRSLAQFVSPDGRTVQFYAALTAGNPRGTAAIQAVPSIRRAVAAVARAVGATDSAVAGQAATARDVSDASNADLAHIIPVVLILITLLLAIVMRSLVAPLYLVASVALSYFAALGVAVLIFMHVGHADGLNFVLPFLMFVFLLALGEDYNILVMSRIREEAHTAPLTVAVGRALAATGATVTSAGLILAATFGVAGILGASRSGPPVRHRHRRGRPDGYLSRAHAVVPISRGSARPMELVALLACPKANAGGRHWRTGGCPGKIIHGAYKLPRPDASIILAAVALIESVEREHVH